MVTDRGTYVRSTHCVLYRTVYCERIRENPGAIYDDWQRSKPHLFCRKDHIYKIKNYMYGGPVIRRGYPLLDDPPAHRARAAKMRWLRVLSTFGWKRAPRLSKVQSKKHFVHFPSSAQYYHTGHPTKHVRRPRE